MISFVKEYISTGIIYCFTSLRKRGVNIKAILSLNLIKAYIFRFPGYCISFAVRSLWEYKF